MIPETIYPGTPPEPGSQYYKDQVAQIIKFCANFDTFEEQQQLCLELFVCDMSYHRGAISQALRELENASRR